MTIPDVASGAGGRMVDLMRRLWPICRSITGPGLRETLAILGERMPELMVHEVPTGTQCFDWTVPKEWVIRGAYVLDPDGRKIIDFEASNLHVVNYSIPVDREIALEELEKHLYSLPEQPDAIPYVTSYYGETWGFCLAHRVRSALRPGAYRVRVDSDLRDGSLTYGEMVFPGRSGEEVLISTYVCHPSMANNELSGPCVTAELAAWLRKQDRRYTYRILFVPETIGTLCYLSQHLDYLKAKVIAGFVVTCVGDTRAWSLMPSRNGDTLSDRVARHVLRHIAPDYTEYSFLERGSDERQYCSPGVDLPVVSVMRSKYGTYPEYHTSLDNLDLVSAEGLEGALAAHQLMLEAIEAQCTPKYRILGEPMLSRRGLRPTLGKRGSAQGTLALLNVLAYADGTRTLIEIAEAISLPVWEVRRLADQLAADNLLSLD